MSIQHETRLNELAAAVEKLTRRVAELEARAVPTEIVRSEPLRLKPRASSPA